MTSLGTLVVATTTDRELVAYTAGGRRQWSSPIEDVSVVPPLPLPGGRVAVATVGGTVSVFDGRDGRELWHRQLDHGVYTPLASDGAVLVAADVGPELHAWDAATGQPYWSHPAGSALGGGVSLVGSDVLVTASGSVVAYDRRSGTQQWQRPVGLALDGVTGVANQVWVSNGGTLEAWSVSEGRHLWSQRGSRPATTSASGCGSVGRPATLLVFRGTRLAALDPDGEVRQEWTLRADPAETRVVRCAAGRIWVLSYAASGDTDLRIQSIGPR